jgi:hypothetical protein
LRSAETASWAERYSSTQRLMSMVVVPGADVLAHVVEHAHVHRGRDLDALDVRRRLDERARKDLLARVVQLVETVVLRRVALLVLPAATAPAGIVASGDRKLVIHEESPYKAVRFSPPHNSD